MIKSLTVILVMAVIGDTLAERYDVGVPGSAIGLLMLAALFAMRRGPDTGSARLFDIVAPHFPLFFVPAAVGIVASIDMLARSWIFVGAAILLGTTATLMVTGMLVQILLKLPRRAKSVPPAALTSGRST